MSVDERGGTDTLHDTDLLMMVPGFNKSTKELTLLYTICEDKQEVKVQYLDSQTKKFGILSLSVFKSCSMFFLKFILKSKLSTLVRY